MPSHQAVAAAVGRSLLGSARRQGRPKGEGVPASATNTPAAAGIITGVRRNAAAPRPSRLADAVSGFAQPCEISRGDSRLASFSFSWKQSATWVWPGGGAFFWAGGVHKGWKFAPHNVVAILAWVPGHPTVLTYLRHWFLSIANARASLRVGDPRWLANQTIRQAFSNDVHLPRKQKQQRAVRLCTKAWRPTPAAPLGALPPLLPDTNRNDHSITRPRNDALPGEEVRRSSHGRPRLSRQ